jgi:hypothetical protein
MLILMAVRAERYETTIGRLPGQPVKVPYMMHFQVFAIVSAIPAPVVIPLENIRPHSFPFRVFEQFSVIVRRHIS